jgi:hypothetical protein
MFAPSHAPAADLPAPAQGGRLPSGAPRHGEHLPTEPAMLQAAHCAVHAALQHTPSTQKFEAHSCTAVQGAPLPALPTQCPPLLQ